MRLGGWGGRGAAKDRKKALKWGVWVGQQAACAGRRAPRCAVTARREAQATRPPTGPLRLPLAAPAPQGHVRSMATDEWGHLALLTALSRVDDTTLLRKALVAELQVGRGPE